MSNRYFIDLSFNGTRFHGWQIQPNASTIQGVLERALHQITHLKLKTTGAGRTDSGVHAKHFIAHFNVEAEFEVETTELTFSLNAVLPTDIVIHRIFRVQDDLHARFSAIARTYEYHIVSDKDPFRHEFVYQYSGKLNLEKMNKAAQMLLHFKDFTSFSKLHSQTMTNDCKIREAMWRQIGPEIIFRIRANRFLRDMVRALVGTMLQVGTGKLKPEEIEQIIHAKDRSKAGPSVPARGLILSSIEYP